MPLKTFSFFTARTTSASSSTAPRDRFAPGSKASMSARTTCRRARPGIGRGSTSRGASSPSCAQQAEAGPLPQLQAAVSVEHGLDRRTSVGALARTMLVDDERVTFVEGSVRRTIGPAMVEVAAARDSEGGMAARAQLLARLGSVNVSAEAITAKDFRLGERAPRIVQRRALLRRRADQARPDDHSGACRRACPRPRRRRPRARGRGPAGGQHRPLQPRHRRPLQAQLSGQRPGAARRDGRRPDRRRPHRPGAAARLDQLRSLAGNAIPRRPSCRVTGRRPKMSIGRARSPSTPGRTAPGRGFRTCGACPRWRWR